MKQSGFRPNIAFAGLTAAGKTTHAKILANELGYTYVSATQIILDIIGMREQADGVWFKNYDKIQKAREGDAVDAELERRVRQMAISRDGLVLDTWAMAWIFDGDTPMVRLWIESDVPSRTRKCFVSQGDKPKNDLPACEALIAKKDQETRESFIRRHNFDLFTDRDRYDIILSNSMLIQEATRSCADQGIHTFAPVLHQAVKYVTDKMNDESFDTNGQVGKQLVDKSDGMITRIKE